jgi:hypothetical protein
MAKVTSKKRTLYHDSDEQAVPTDAEEKQWAEEDRRRLMRYHFGAVLSHDKGHTMAEIDAWWDDVKRKAMNAVEGGSKGGKRTQEKRKREAEQWRQPMTRVFFDLVKRESAFIKKCSPNRIADRLMEHPTYKKLSNPPKRHSISPLIRDLKKKL